MYFQSWNSTNAVPEENASALVKDKEDLRDDDDLESVDQFAVKPVLFKSIIAQLPGIEKGENSRFL